MKSPKFEGGSTDWDVNFKSKEAIDWLVTFYADLVGNILSSKQKLTISGRMYNKMYHDIRKVYTIIKRGKNLEAGIRKHV